MEGLHTAFLKRGGVCTSPDAFFLASNATAAILTPLNIMIPVKFTAHYLPKHRVFRVVVKAGSNKSIVERMSISKFMRFARQADKPLVVGGIKIEFTGGDGEPEIRAYFKEVADSYLKHTAKNN